MGNVNLRLRTDWSSSICAAVVACALTGASLAAQATQPATPARPAPAVPRQTPATPKQSDPRDSTAQKVEQQGALPTARAIIDKYIEALGGRKAILAHTSSHASGTMTVQGSEITGGLDIY